MLSSLKSHTVHLHTAFCFLAELDGQPIAEAWLTVSGLLSTILAWIHPSQSNGNGGDPTGLKIKNNAVRRLIDRRK